MGNVVFMMSTSIDGYMADADGGLGWQLIDEEVHQHFNDVLRPAAAFVDGRVTYELMVDYWPTADQQPDSAPPEREFAGIWRDKPKYVVSTTLERAEWNTVVARDIGEVPIAELKERGDVFVGGAVVARAMRERGLIDEYRIYVHPVVLGRGRPMFEPTDHPATLALTDTRTFRNGVVLLRYSAHAGAAQS